MPCTSAPAGQDVPYEPRSSRGAPQRTVHRRPAITAAVPLQGKTVLPVTSCVAAPATPRPATDAPRPRRSGRGLGPGEERAACLSEAVDHGHPSPSSRRGGTTRAPSERAVSRETRPSAMPSDSACLFTPHPPGRTHSRRSPPGDRSLRRAPSSSAAPSGDDRSRPPARQPFTAGAPRPAISAAASRYATAPAEVGS